MCYQVPKTKGPKNYIKELQGKTEFFFHKMNSYSKASKLQCTFDIIYETDFSGLIIQLYALSIFFFFLQIIFLRDNIVFTAIKLLFIKLKKGSIVEKTIWIFTLCAMKIFSEADK